MRRYYLHDATVLLGILDSPEVPAMLVVGHLFVGSSTTRQEKPVGNGLNMFKLRSDTIGCRTSFFFALQKRFTVKGKGSS